MKIFRWLLMTLIITVSFVGIYVPITHAQPSAVWNTQFFNDSYLINAVVSRQDSGVAFNWGSGSPASGVNADGFTARFGTNTYFSGGSYRFYVLADDSAQLFIDGSRVIATFDQPRPGQVLTADVTLTAGNHNIQLDYREVNGDAYVYLDWQNLASNPTGPRFGTTQAPAPVTNGSWTAQYFNNVNLSGSPSAVLSEVSPSHNWGGGAPAAGISSDNFSARYTSTQTLGGSYIVQIRADDGVRFFVDGVAYINEWHGASGRQYTANFSVAQGNHTLTIEYYEASGAAFLEYQLVPVTGGPITSPQATIGWTAQYFANINLTGSPSFVVTENSPTHNWGSAAPLANMPADNFSVRWTSVQPLTSGTYRINVRADDGVRVTVNGMVRINEWRNADGARYSATLELPTGNHNFMIEYFEATGNAIMEYSLTRIGDVITGNPVTQPSSGTVTNAQATVTVSSVNIRNSPNSITGRVITRVSRGDVLRITGRNADSTWWQVNANGTSGWVSAQFVSASNIQNVPVVANTTTINPPSTGYTVTATAAVNLRSGPSTDYAVLGIVPRGVSAQILARNSDTTWWKVSYNGAVGWVSAPYVTLQPSADLNRIPVVPN